MEAIIDLRSDTVTLPTTKMRQAMSAAEVGDDVYREDPTVNQLEEKAAALAGKQAGLFVASGSMGNLVALLTHLRRGDSAIIGSICHIACHEQGGISSLAGAYPKTIENAKGGILPLDQIRAAIEGEDIHVSPVKLICLENTWNGAVLELDYMQEVKAIADQQRLKTHLDGARIFNACIANKISLKDYGKTVDSIQFCFSKGLSAPVGSMLVGDADFIAEARRNRKLLGGGMRQAGIIAVACIVALDEMVQRLEEDHGNAKLLSELLANISGIKVVEPFAQTNMVFFDIDEKVCPDKTRQWLVQSMKTAGVLMGIESKLGIRAVTHYGLNAADMKETAKRIDKIMSEALCAVTK